MEEKRQACPRLAINLRITFQETGDPVNSYILNLSSGGIFIDTDDPPPIDSTLSLLFHLPDDHEPMSLEGRVVWIKQTANACPSGMGIEFTGISPFHKQKIQSFVESRAQN